MKPDRWDIVIDKINEETGYDKKFIKDLMKFYWKKLRISIMNMDSYRIYAEGFGTFEVMIYRAHKLHDKLKQYVDNIPIDTVTRYKKRAKMEDIVKRAERVINLYRQDKEKFIQVMIKRYGKYTPRMEK